MVRVNHQLNWALLVAGDRAKAYGVFWTDEEKKKLAGKKQTPDQLRAAWRKEEAKRLLEADAEAEKIAKKVGEEKKKAADKKIADAEAAKKVTK